MKFYLALLFVLCWETGFSQPEATNEQIFVHLNSTFLLTGETLYFNVFSRQGKNNTPGMLSKVAYVELVNEQASPVFQAKVFLNKGNGHGDLFIPSNFTSGNYTLIAYTRWMKNFGTGSFFTKEITIVNPFIRSDATARGRPQVSKESTTPAISGDVQLKLSASTFKPRKKATITLTSDHVANVSISVRKKEASLNDSGTILKNAATNDAAGAAKPEKKFLPEIRGHLITGTIVPKTGEASRKRILASIPGSDFVFRATTTDQAGNFALIVDNFPETSTMLFQVVDDDISNYTVTIDNPFLDDYSKFKPGPLSIDNNVRNVVDERSIYTQIENAYYETKKDSFATRPPASFYGVPDKIYRLDDFTRFPTMEDVFREYVPEVILRQVKGVFGVYVVNSTGFPYLKEPLILLDGVPILDTRILMAYDPLKIERIEIVKSRYVYGSLESEGIVSLKTYEGAMEDLPPISSHRQNIVRIQAGKIYEFPDYATDQAKLARVPDYRLQLHWASDVTTSKEPTSISFCTSDITGDFEVIVEGFSTDGAIVSQRQTFSVVK